MKLNIRASILHRQLAGRTTLRSAPVQSEILPYKYASYFLRNSDRAYCQKPDVIKLIRYRRGYYPACDCAPQLRLNPNNEARTLIHRAEVS